MPHPLSLGSLLRVVLTPSSQPDRLLLPRTCLQVDLLPLVMFNRLIMLGKHLLLHQLVSLWLYKAASPGMSLLSNPSVLLLYVISMCHPLLCVIHLSHPLLISLSTLMMITIVLLCTLQNVRSSGLSGLLCYPLWPTTTCSSCASLSPYAMSILTVSFPVLVMVHHRRSCMFCVFILMVYSFRLFVSSPDTYKYQLCIIGIFTLAAAHLRPTNSLVLDFSPVHQLPQVLQLTWSCLSLQGNNSCSWLWMSQLGVILLRCFSVACHSN